MMGILRMFLSFFAVKPFRSMNFYGKYIIGLAAAFIIILIATKSHDNYWILLLVALNEFFGIFRNNGDADATEEIIKEKAGQIYTFGIIKWVALLFAVVMLIFYSGMIAYIYAPLAVLTGLSMIFLYNGYSKTYAKKLTERETTTIGTTKKIQILNVISALMVMLIYAAMIWVKDNTVLYVAWICLAGIMFELGTKDRNKNNNSFYEGAGLIVLALIRYIV